MTAVWADFSSGRPGSAALRAAGITGVIRYVGVGSASKRITAAEYADYAANGIEVRLVVELGVHDAESGYTAGVTNANLALSDARSLGIPDTVGIAAAADEHLAANKITTALAYVQGFRDVLGGARTGAYGFAEFIDAVHTADLAGWWWKSGNAPTLSESSWVTFWQRNNGTTTETINKVVVDLNDQTNSLTEPDDMTPDEHAWLEDVMRRVQQWTLNGGVALPVDASGNPVASDWREGANMTAMDGHLSNAVAPVLTQLTALSDKPASPLSADQLAALEAAVVTAVAGLNLSVSTADQTAIAKAVAAELGAKLSA